MRKIAIFTLLAIISLPVNAQQVKRFDSNGDQLADIWVHTLGKYTKKTEIDTDYDGKVDQTNWLYLPEKGGNKRLEMDTNGDEKIDGWQYYEKDKIIKYKIDTNFDGKVDVIYYMDGLATPQRIEAKTTYRDDIDMIQAFAENKFYHAKIDTNSDGIMDKMIYDVKELNTWLELNRPEFQDRLRAYMGKF